MKRLGSPTYIIIGLTLAVFLVTKNPFTAAWRLQLALVGIVVFLAYGYRAKRRNKLPSSDDTQDRTLYYLLTTVVLLVVATTGWFFSPFFFSLYLLAVVLAFVFPLSTALGFVATLVGLFSFNIGEVDLAYDFLVVLSLLTVIPIALYLRREYLKLKESEKEILILKQQRQQAYKDIIEEILGNTVEQFAENLRQPLNDTKQLVHHLASHQEKAELKHHLDELEQLSDQALLALRKFEEDATGERLVSSVSLDKKLLNPLQK